MFFAARRDDLRIDYTHSPVVQADDYYPFGLAFNSYSTGIKNDYLYNGKELQDELDLGWYDYGARMYDAAIGRWFVSDPMADMAHLWTPYRYGFNNPVMYTDPTGMYEYSDGYSTKDTKYETGSVSHSGSFTGNAGDIEKGSTAGTTVMAQVESGGSTTAASSASSSSGKLEGAPTGQGEGEQNGVRPDLGVIGNSIRDQVSGDSFNKDLFEQYWLGRGDMTLTRDQFIKIVNAGLDHNGGSVTSSRAITLSNGQQGVAKVINYYNTPYALGLGRATVYYDAEDWPVGFSDAYDFNPLPLGTRSPKAEAITRAVNAAGSLHGAKPFTISFGIGPK